MSSAAITPRQQLLRDADRYGVWPEYVRGLRPMSTKGLDKKRIDADWERLRKLVARKRRRKAAA